MEMEEMAERLHRISRSMESMNFRDAVSAWYELDVMFSYLLSGSEDYADKDPYMLGELVHYVGMGRSLLVERWGDIFTGERKGYVN